jgi:hypothetical protein
MNCLVALSCGFWLRLFRLPYRGAWSRRHGWVYTARPHTGVPEIGRSIQTHPCRTKGSALPVASAKPLCSLPVARQSGRRRDRVCKSTGFWYSIPPYPSRTKGSALPVALAKTSCSIPVARHCGRRRDRVCKSTDFWYSIPPYPSRTKGSALPVASAKPLCSLPVARQSGRRRDRVCKSTDFWYSSMRAVCIHDLARSDTCARTAKHNKVQTHSDTPKYKN